MADRTIHLVFKTHLDIGFTDHASKVRTQYHERFIPQALDTAEHFYAEDSAEPKFIWTTGAWLIWDHLNSQPADNVARLERAIDRGLIRWHVLPFTTHTELMSPALFKAGLSYAAELDKRFGKTSTAAKMTDVPGHTLGMVPLLAQAGVRFLHLGVNSASPVPDVPEIFRWRAPDGAEILVMYQASYGATHFPEGFDHGLSFAHTNDNMGPQSAPQTVEVYRHFAHEHPDAKVVASSLDAYGDLLWARREDFPVLDIELGDSWIHGSASDPIKTARFLALQRLYDGFDTLTPARQAFGRGLAMVAEHTCGVDIKSYLRDETAWDRPAFEAARKGDHRFAFTEQSWAEQRAYLDAAVAELDGADQTEARAVLAELAAPMPAEGQGVATVFSVGSWQVSLDEETGDIVGLTAPSGTVIAGLDDSLIGYRYESYDAADVTRHLDTYLTTRPEWAILDHAKPGLEQAASVYSGAFEPTLGAAWRDGQRALARLTLPELAHRQLGAPARVDLIIEARGSDLVLSYVLIGKPANRMPEASFIHLTPADAGDWRYHKMGLWQPGDRIARRGGGQLQAVSGVQTTLAEGRVLSITPLDTPLVAPAGTPFMPFNPEPPDLSFGVRFNLHNNKWGTNFPMWWEGDLLARFVVRVK